MYTSINQKYIPRRDSYCILYQAHDQYFLIVHVYLKRYSIHNAS